MNIGERIEQCRKSRGLTQTKLAEMTATDQTMISMIETGRRVPGVMLLRDIALALNYSMDYLVGINDEKIR